MDCRKNQSRPRNKHLPGNRRNIFGLDIASAPPGLLKWRGRQNAFQFFGRDLDDQMAIEAMNSGEENLDWGESEEDSSKILEETPYLGLYGHFR